MNQRLTAFSAFIIASLPATAFAEEAGAGLSPFSGNVGNAIWTLVIFVIVVAVLGKFAWAPILNLLKEREQFIHDALVSANGDRRDRAAAGAGRVTAVTPSSVVVTLGAPDGAPPRGNGEGGRAGQSMSIFARYHG